MRNVLSISLVARVCILGMAATAARMAEAGNPPPSAEEQQANAYATVRKADAEILKAQISWIQAVANIRKMQAETAKLLQEVRSLHLDNQLKTCDTYFKKRERREQYKAAHPQKRLAPEGYVRVCNASMPKRLMKYQYDANQGKICWPELLQQPEFAHCRDQLETLFVLNHANSAGLGGEFQHEVNTLSRQMQAELKGKVREVSQMEYIAAKNFIKGLAYEAQFVPQLEAVAAN